MRWPSTNRRAVGGVTVTHPIRARDGRGRSCDVPPRPFEAGEINSLVVGRWTHLGCRPLNCEEAIRRLVLGLGTGR